MQSWQSFRLHQKALALGVLVGMSAVLVVTFAGLYDEATGFLDVLARLTAIYGSTGLAAGWAVERAEQQHGRARRFAPTGVHGYLAALAVALGHALVLAFVHHGDFANLAFFGAEVFVVTVLAGVVGGLAGEAFRAVHPATA